MGRRAQGVPPASLSGSSRQPRAPTPPPTNQRTPPSADYEEQLSDSLMEANTKLNRVIEDRDKLKSLYDQATKKLAESARVTKDVRAEVADLAGDKKDLKARLQQTNEENSKLQYDLVAWEEAYNKLETVFQSLQLQLKAANANASSGAGPAAALPERPKPSSRNPGAKKEHKEHRESRDAERGRGRDRDRDRDRGHERAKQEQKAQKERLSNRFDDKRPPTSGRRQSFIEGWGPGPSRGRSASATPGTRTSYANMPVSTSRIQPLATTPSRPAAYSAVPRTTNPLGYSSGSSTAYDEYDDGNYRAYPIVR